MKGGDAVYPISMTYVRVQDCDMVEFSQIMIRQMKDYLEKDKIRSSLIPEIRQLKDKLENLSIKLNKGMDQTDIFIRNNQYKDARDEYLPTWRNARRIYEDLGKTNMENSGIMLCHAINELPGYVGFSLNEVRRNENKIKVIRKLELYYKISKKPKKCYNEWLDHIRIFRVSVSGNFRTTEHFLVLERLDDGRMLMVASDLDEYLRYAVAKQLKREIPEIILHEKDYLGIFDNGSQQPAYLSTSYSDGEHSIITRVGLGVSMITETGNSKRFKYIFEHF